MRRVWHDVDLARVLLPILLRQTAVRNISSPSRSGRCLPSSCVGSSVESSKRARWKKPSASSPSVLVQEASEALHNQAELRNYEDPETASKACQEVQHKGAERGQVWRRRKRNCGSGKTPSCLQGLPFRKWYGTHPTVPLKMASEANNLETWSRSRAAAVTSHGGVNQVVGDALRSGNNSRHISSGR